MRPIPPRGAAPTLPTWVWKRLTDADDTFTDLERAAQYFAEPDALMTAWREWGEEIVRQWARLYPGKRPSPWWEFSAPEPRRRLGGIGTVAWERLRAIVPTFRLGVPTQWITDDDLAAYEIIGHPLNVTAVDQRFPPLYESQPAYLRRHGLLTVSEERQLAPVAFIPEPITDIL